MLGLLLLWMVDSLSGGPFWTGSRHDVGLAVLLAPLAIGAPLYSVPALTVPKVTSLLLGLGLYRLLLRRARDPRGLWMGVVVLFALALLFSVVGLANGLRPSKVQALHSLLSSFPLWLKSLPEAQSGRVSMNQLGGALLYVVPLGLSLVLAPVDGSSRARVRLAHRTVAFLATVPLLSVLLLTQSRSAWAGLAAGAVAFSVLRSTWARRTAIVLVVLAAMGWLVWGRVRLAPLLTQALVAEEDPRMAMGALKFAGRWGVWVDALTWIRTSPLLGCGFGTFRARAATLSARSIYDTGLPHAHNVFLQVAYDAGLVGLLGYLSLVASTVRTAWRGCRHGRGLSRATSLGGLCALVASHVYGLTDVVALGAKPGVLFWGLLALIATCPGLEAHALTTATDANEGDPGRSGGEGVRAPWPVTQDTSVGSTPTESGSRTREAPVERPKSVNRTLRSTN